MQFFLKVLISFFFHYLMLRLVSILPNRIVQPIAEHSEYPIERLGIVFDSFLFFPAILLVLNELLYSIFLTAFSNDRKYLGSISHDQMLKVNNSLRYHVRNYYYNFLDTK